MAGTPERAVHWLKTIQCVGFLSAVVSTAAAFDAPHRGAVTPAARRQVSAASHDTRCASVDATCGQPPRRQSEPAVRERQGAVPAPAAVGKSPLAAAAGLAGAALVPRHVWSRSSAGPLAAGRTLQRAQVRLQV